MPSLLYTPTEFYELQKKGKVARNTNPSKKLRKTNTGSYYLKKKTAQGQVFKQDVPKDSMVYARSGTDGVTMYSPKRDRKRTDVRVKKETPKQHRRKAHMYDRINKNDKDTYI